MENPRLNNKITILIPNYNNGPFLNECINSILNQSYKDFSVLFVDDGSTDNSIDIINQYNDNRFTLLTKQQNSGIIDTLNIGLKHIGSEYIIRMDGDDIMHPKRIEKLVNYMDNNKDVGACGSAIKHFGISEETIIYGDNPDKNNANLIFKHSIGHASVIFRNSILKANHIRYSDGYTYMEDYKLFYDLSKVTKMTSIPDALYLYRREEYNNYKHKDIIKKGFKKVYLDVIKSLGIQNPKDFLDIHYELGHLRDFSHSFKEYDKYLKILLNKNKIYHQFPELELLIVFKELKEKLFYKLTDEKKLTFFDGIPFFLKSPKKLYYYLKSRQ